MRDCEHTHTLMHTERRRLTPLQNTIPLGLLYSAHLQTCNVSLMWWRTQFKCHTIIIWNRFSNEHACAFTHADTFKWRVSSSGLTASHMNHEASHLCEDLVIAGNSPSEHIERLWAQMCSFPITEIHTHTHTFLSFPVSPTWPPPNKRLSSSVFISH